MLASGDCESLFALILKSALLSLLTDSFLTRATAELSRFETGELDFFPFFDCSDRFARSALLRGESKLDFFSEGYYFLDADV